MGKREELELFLERVDELIESKYILADIKIVNVLKAIASSDTILALFKNCLADFDYWEAQKKYLIKSQYLGENKGEYVMPPNSRELLSFVFSVLMDIDAKRIILGDFISKYFYVDGSFSSSYEAFINSMIKPFKNSVKVLMENVIEGKLQDPVEAVTEEEQKRAKEAEDAEKQQAKEKELLEKAYGKSVKEIKELLLADKQLIKTSSIKDNVKNEIILVIDMLANVVDSQDKDAIEYAFVSYKYVCKAFPIKFLGRVKKIDKLLKDVVNGL